LKRKRQNLKRGDNFGRRNAKESNENCTSIKEMKIPFPEAAAACIPTMRT
jgi:hypothetical protein